MPAIERDDPVGTEANRQHRHGGIHGAQRQVRVLSDETAYANPVVRIRGNHWKIRKPFQESGLPHLHCGVYRGNRQLRLRTTQG